MAINIQEVSLETTFSELTGILNFNFGSLKSVLDQTTEYLNVNTGELDLTNSAVGSVKAKSMIVTQSGITIQQGNLIVSNGALSLNSSEDFNAADTRAFFKSAYLTEKFLNSGLTMKNFKTVNASSIIDTTNTSTVLITATGVYSLSNGVVEIFNSETFSQEITLVYTPTIGVDPATISGILGGGTIEMSPNSCAVLRYIGSSWTVISLHNAIII